jgi:transcription antitermination factor NusG
MSQGVLNYVYWQGKPAIIRDKEIAILQNQLTNRVIPEGKVGDFIQIKDGVFKGLEGTIKEIQTNKTIITLESLGITIHLSSL